MARRLRDAAVTLSHSQASSIITAATGRQAPAYVAGRVEAGVAPPLVEMRGVQGRGGLKRDADEEELLKLREAVARYVVGGMKGELLREWVGMV
jgi:hypothetical protein